MQFLIFASALIFFTFVGLCVGKYGLLSCYSAYGPKWQINVPGNLNIWQIITIWTALLIVPVTIEMGTDPFKFFGFLAPAGLLFVGSTPDYQSSFLSFVLHQVGAISAVIFIVAYAIILSDIWWILLILVAIAVILSLIKKGTWMFWGEMAVYLGIYIILLASNN